MWKKITLVLFLQSYIDTSQATLALAKTSTASASHSDTTRPQNAITSKTGVPKSAPQHVKYRLKTEYNATNFFNEFEFFTAADPTNGAVEYQSKQNAFRLGLANKKDVSVPGLDPEKSSVVHLAAQSGALPSSSIGRPSVRLTSHQNFTQGLFVADFTHLPKAECGIWPAFWTGSIEDWPSGGEIDIVEGVNVQTNNEVVLHTGGKCSMASDNDQMTGVPGSPNCDTADGCTAKDSSPASYGEGFNQGGGGVYAMEWTEKSIKVWWWPRKGIPEDIRDSQPSPSGWPTPLASFSGGGCEFGKLFRNHQIVFDVTFCGDWAGKQEIWNQDCAAKHGPSCTSHVLTSKTGFKDTYWDISSVKVYQNS